MSAEDTEALLERLGEIRERIVLVGGQAVNVWVNHYMRQGRVDDLIVDMPFTSKDIDFHGSRADVQDFAQRVAGKERLPDMDNATGMVGFVLFVDRLGFQRQADFVPPFGMREKEVVQESLILEMLSPSGAATGITCRVMNPVHCMESRVHNVVGLPDQYDTPQGHKQLRAAVSCAREFVRDILDLPRGGSLDPARAARDLNEQIFRLCTQDRHGKVVQHQTGIDPFTALLIDPRLGAGFVARRYPQMCARLAEIRAKITGSKRA